MVLKMKQNKFYANESYTYIQRVLYNISAQSTKGSKYESGVENKICKLNIYIWIMCTI